MKRMFLVAALTATLACKGSGSSGSSPTAGSATEPAAGGPAVADAAPPAVDAGTVVDAAPAIDAAPASTAVPTPAGAPRVVLIHGPELLGSEQKAVDRLRGGLARGRNSAALVDASPDEEAVARAWIDHAEPGTSPALPAAWAAAPVVLVLELLPPIGEKPRRQSGGLGAWVAFRPPSTDPVIVQRGQPAGPDLGDEGAVQAVLDTLALAAGATP